MPNPMTKKSGFTLVETLVAVLVLTISIGGILALAAGGFHSVRYARNQIVANNLLQESLEYIRNTRDTATINDNSSLWWDNWKHSLQVDQNGNQTGLGNDGCFSDNGCIVNPYSISPSMPIKKCSTTCPVVSYFENNSFYGYLGESYPFTPSGTIYPTSFIRKIKITPSSTNPDQLIVQGSIIWKNGSLQKTLSQSLLLTNWRP